MACIPYVPAYMCALIRNCSQLLYTHNRSCVTTPKQSPGCELQLGTRVRSIRVQQLATKEHPDQDLPAKDFPTEDLPTRELQLKDRPTPDPQYKDLPTKELPTKEPPCTEILPTACVTSLTKHSKPCYRRRPNCLA